MTDVLDIDKFWDDQHRQSSSWLTGTNWLSYRQCYGMRDQDLIDSTCLEIGVGKGIATRELAALVPILYCCDISQTALDKIKDIATQCWLSQDLDQVPPVDVVICHLVFVHCDDAECIRILRSIRLKPEGRVFCQFSTFKDSAVGATDASSRVQQKLDLGRKHFFRDTDHVQQIVHSAGLQIHNIDRKDPGDFDGWNGQIWQLLELRQQT